MKKTTLIGLALIGLMVGAVAAGVAVQLYYPNVGQIASIELYLDDTLRTNGTAIDWGSCEPGETYFFENMTILNKGQVALNITIIPYNLPATWTLQWQSNKTIIAAGSHAGGELNLTIPATATTWPTWGFYINADDGT